jgi:hypothetical protein
MSSMSAYYQEGTYCFRAAHFYTLAAIAADKCHPSDSALDALTAQIMAAVTAEAFLEEFAFCLCGPRRPERTTDLTRVGAILAQLENSRVQIADKYRIASELLPGDPFDPGHQPFQSFSQLIKLRNYLAHPKLMDKPPNWFAYFASNKLLLQDANAKFIMSDWAMQLHSRKLALWACRAAIRIIMALIERVREPSVTQGVPGIYESLYAMWEWTAKDTRIWTGQPSDAL